MHARWAIAVFIVMSVIVPNTVPSGQAQLICGSTGRSELVHLDLSQGNAVRRLSMVGPLIGSPLGVAVDDQRAVLYWCSDFELFSARYSTSNTLITTHAGGTIFEENRLTYFGLAFDAADATLYGFSNEGVRAFYAIDPATATARRVCTVEPNVAFSGFDYDPIGDAFYVINNNTTGFSGRGLYRITKPLASPTYTFITALPAGDTNIGGLAIGNGRAYLVNTGPQPIYVYNLTTGQFESPISNPLTNGTTAGGAWAPGLNVQAVGADLFLAMTDSPDCFAGLGQLLTYTISVHNAGPEPATGVVVSQHLPNGAVFVDSMPAGAVNEVNVLTVGLPNIPAGGVGTLTVRVMPAGAGLLTTQATATAGQVDPIANNNMASAQTQVLESIPATARARGILSNLANSSSSMVQGMPGLRINTYPIGTPFRSPNGSLWLVSVLTTSDFYRDEMLLRGSGSTYGMVLREGAAGPGGDLGPFSPTMGINDSGNFALTSDYGNNVLPNTTDMGVLKSVNGVLTLLARFGDPVPTIPDATFDQVLGNVSMQNNNTASFFGWVRLPSGLDTDVVLRSDGAVQVLQAGVDRPANQYNGENYAYGLFDYDQTNSLLGYFPDATGLSYIMSNQCTAPSSRNRIVAVNNAVVLQEGSVVPESEFTSPLVSYQQVRMESDGSWFCVRGRNADDTKWVVRNGTVIAAAGMPIVPGSEERWRVEPNHDVFVFAFGNPRGDYVVGGATNGADGRTNGAAVLNRTRVVARENDPVDLDNNGVFDDGVYIRNFVKGKGFLTNTELYLVVDLRGQTAALCNGTDNNLGQAFIRIPLAPPAAPGDVNCDGATDGEDIAAFVTAVLDPTNYATLYPNCNILNADANSDGAATAADAAGFAGMLIGG